MNKPLSNNIFNKAYSFKFHCNSGNTYCTDMLLNLISNNPDKFDVEKCFDDNACELFDVKYTNREIISPKGCFKATNDKFPFLRYYI